MSRILTAEGKRLSRAVQRSLQRRAVGTLVIFKSPVGTNQWEAVKPDDVPGWVKDPDVLGEMVDGNAAHREGEEFEYIAQKAETIQ